ncbi:hypothetical protein GCM10025762_31690 [Haloechinothrix salitolerans]
MLARALGVLVMIVFAIMLPTASAAAQDGESVHGTVRDPGGDPVKGVSISVTQDGAEVGSTSTDADGAWRIEVPEPGTYQVELDLATLPDGVVPRERGGEVVEVTVDEGDAQPVILPLVEEGEQVAPGGSDGQEAEETPAPPADTDEPTPGETGVAPAAGASFFDRFIQTLVNGIQYGAVIAISAIGLSLVFGTTRLINFAHGELVTFGAVVALFFHVVGPGMPLILAAVLAVLAGGLLGGVLERGLWRPLRNRGTGRINLFIISIGLALFLRHIILALQGSRPESYIDFNLQQSWDLGLFSITPRDLSIVLISVAVLLGVAFMLQRTRIGTAIRAVSDNRDLASSSGINVNQVIMVVWVLGGGLAALGGVLFGLAQVVHWEMGFKLLLLMFAGIILGGLGSAYGAMVGSFVVGIVSHLSTLWFPAELQNAWALLVLIIVLLFRPQGILGRKERVG